MKILPLFLIWLLLPVVSNALTVEEAYNAIPHTRAPYDPGRSTRETVESQFLSELLALSDRALVQRITAMRAMSAGKPGALATYESEVDNIVRDIEALSEPASAKGLGSILVQAIRGQQEFFRSWARASENGQAFAVPRGAATSGVDSTIRASSGRLHQLYGELMRRYANESPENKNSFFQHLCALDFI